MQRTTIRLGVHQPQLDTSGVYPHTFLLLNVLITVSAPDFSTKVISAMTVGVVATRRHSVICPPTSSMTLSMSAAVVPGAKLEAMTTCGPAAAPLMLTPGPLPFVAAASYPPCPLLLALLMGSDDGCEKAEGLARWLSVVGGRLKLGGLRAPRIGAVLERVSDEVR